MRNVGVCVCASVFNDGRMFEFINYNVCIEPIGIHIQDHSLDEEDTHIEVTNEVIG